MPADRSQITQRGQLALLAPTGSKPTRLDEAYDYFFSQNIEKGHDYEK